jgi:hypothetical protein
MKYLDDMGIVHYAQRPGRGQSFGERKYTVCEGPFGNARIMYATFQLIDLPKRSPMLVTCIICLVRRRRAG